jgi:hypothetical protein
MSEPQDSFPTPEQITGNVVASVNSSRRQDSHDTCTGTISSMAARSFERFRRNLPGLIDEDFIGQYHSLLDTLQQAGQTDLQTFRIDAANVTFRIVRAQSADFVYPPEKTQYSNKKYCDKDYFSAQVEKAWTFIKGGERSHQ